MERRRSGPASSPSAVAAAAIALFLLSILSSRFNGSVDGTIVTDSTPSVRDCKVLWRRMDATNSRHGSVYAFVQSVDECQHKCLLRLNCSAVDVDRSQPRLIVCWIHDRPVLQTFDAPTVTHFRLINRCGFVSPPPPPRHLTSIPMKECNNSWKISRDVHLGGGILVEGRTTLDECLRFCLERESCIAVGVDSHVLPSLSVECWVHTNRTDLLFRGSAKNVVLYELIDRCQSSHPGHVARNHTTTRQPPFNGATRATGSTNVTAGKGPSGATGIYGTTGLGRATGGCCLTWLRLANVHSFGAVPLDLGSLGGGSSVNLETCKSVCLSVATCRAIDWERETNTCWIHTDPLNLSKRVASEDFDQYLVVGSQSAHSSNIVDSFASRNESSALDSRLTSAIVSLVTSLVCCLLVLSTALAIHLCLRRRHRRRHEVALRVMSINETRSGDVTCPTSAFHSTTPKFYSPAGK